jgi:hypothetical protein
MKGIDIDNENDDAFPYNDCTIIWSGVPSSCRESHDRVMVHPTRDDDTVIVSKSVVVFILMYCRFFSLNTLETCHEDR